jgi:hypothetical protein
LYRTLVLLHFEMSMSQLYLRNAQSLLETLSNLKKKVQSWLFAMSRVIFERIKDVNQIIFFSTTTVCT